MATLGLNMIIAAGEADLLHRCLTSVNAQQTFDEIVIVNTSTDSDIDRTASEFGAHIIAHQWASKEHPHGDFAGARNCALLNSTTDYIMWLDADDIVQEKYQPGLETLRAIFIDGTQPICDIYYLPYALEHDHNLNPTKVAFRDRIFKRVEGIHWLWPVHEVLNINADQLSSENIEFLQISHLREKPKKMSYERNIRILRHEITTNNSRAFHPRYFLSRDLASRGDLAEAAELAKSMLTDFPTAGNTLHSLCMTLAFNFAYGGLRTRPQLEEFQIKESATIEWWLKAAIQCYPQNAEPYFLLGELYNLSGNLAQAEQMYTKATQQPVRTGMAQAEPLYCELPSQRLADIYVKAGRLEHALWINRQALQANTDSESIRSQRQNILDALVNEAI